MTRRKTGCSKYLNLFFTIGSQRRKYYGLILSVVPNAGCHDVSSVRADDAVA